MLIVFPRSGRPRAAEKYRRSSAGYATAPGLLRGQIAAAFGDDPRSPVTDQLARFALAAIDGAFAATKTDRMVTLERLPRPLVPSLVAARRTLLAKAGGR